VVHQELFPIFSTVWAIGTSSLSGFGMAVNTAKGLYSAYSGVSSAIDWLFNKNGNAPTAAVVDQGGGGMSSSVAWTLGSYVAYNIGKYALDQFTANNGPHAQQKIADLVHRGWVESMDASSFFTKPKIKENIGSMLVTGETAAKGSSITMTKTIMSQISANNRILLGIIFSMLTVFTHSLGAREMQRQISKKMEKKGRINTSFSATTTTTITNDDKDNNDDELELWNKIDPLSKETQVVYHDFSTLFSLREKIQQLYIKSSFYSENKKDVSIMSNLNNDCDPVRIIFNILLGATMQANAFIGLKSSREDSILLFTQWASIVMYWEIIAHLLHIHGWAPLYLALVKISQMLAGFEYYNHSTATATLTDGKHINNKALGKKMPPRRRWPKSIF